MSAHGHHRFDDLGACACGVDWLPPIDPSRPDAATRRPRPIVTSRNVELLRLSVVAVDGRVDTVSSLPSSK